MRVNHAGEVAAQGLYQGQALMAKSDSLRKELEQAAVEETDHLRWCAQRIQELGGSTSKLNILWYAGAFTMGAITGKIGDKWSLGFVAETESQVVKHLQSHLKLIPEEDKKSRAVITVMIADETTHKNNAMMAGGCSLPPHVRFIMMCYGKVMTSLSYYQ